jgi:hypothetical protein
LYSIIEIYSIKKGEFFLKKIIAILLLTFLMFSTLTNTITYADKDDIYLSSGKTLQTLGVLVGDNGDLMLKKNLKRQEMVVLISRLYKDEDMAKSFIGKPKFKDIPENDNYYPSFIAWAVDRSLIEGRDKDTFGYNEETTVKEFQTVLLRALGYEEESGLWNSVSEFSQKLGIMNNLDISPRDSLNRGQMAVMTLNTLKLTKKGSTLTLAEVLGIELNPEGPIATNIKR